MKLAGGECLLVVHFILQILPDSILSLAELPINVGAYLVCSESAAAQYERGALDSVLLPGFGIAAYGPCCALSRMVGKEPTNDLRGRQLTLGSAPRGIHVIVALRDCNPTLRVRLKAATFYKGKKLASTVSIAKRDPELC